MSDLNNTLIENNNEITKITNMKKEYKEFYDKSEIDLQSAEKYYRKKIKSTENIKNKTIDELNKVIVQKETDQDNY
jgi:uncharacterized coiled-coil protein SlyX